MVDMLFQKNILDLANIVPGSIPRAVDVGFEGSAMAIASPTSKHTALADRQVKKRERLWTPVGGPATC